MVDELREVEIELKRLREDASHQETVARQLKKENTLLKGRNDYLVNKLKEASYVYGEAGKRLLYFINNQVNPVIERLNKLEGSARKLVSEDNTLAGSVLSLQKSLNESSEKLNARITTLSQDLDAREEKLGRVIKGSVRKSERGDMGMAERLDALTVEFDKKQAALSTSLLRKSAAGMSAMDKKVAGSVNMLRERNLLLGKDIEALSRFEADISGLDGRLQKTIANQSQAKIDMEKLSQSVRNAMSNTQAAIDGDMKKLAAGLDRKLSSSSSELKGMDEKNLAKIRLQLNESNASLNKMIEAGKADILSFERSLKRRMHKVESDLMNELGTSIHDFEERLQLLERGISANSKNHKDFEHAILNKVSGLETGLAGLSGDVRNLTKMKSHLAGLVKHADAIGERIDRTEAGMADNMEAFKDRFERNRIVMKNELEKIDKKIDDRVRTASSELAGQNSDMAAKMREGFSSDMNSVMGKVDLLSKDVARLKSIPAEMKGLADGIVKGQQADAALQAKLGSMSQGISDKSERDDMELMKQLDLLKSEIKNGMEAAESRITSDNVKAFSAARHSLKQDVHALREENAALKAEVKGLHAIAGAVDELQKRWMAVDKKVEDSSNAIEKVSAGMSAKLENDALRVSKEMAGTAARLKADLRGMLAGEKESFGRQSASLDTKFQGLESAVDGVGKKLADMAGGLESSSQFSMANRKQLDQLDRGLKNVLKEIVSWKKEYKMELGRLLKEIEG
jgi:hypothetical protein